MDVWVERELEGCEFPDKRLKSRLGKVLGELGERIGADAPDRVPGLGRDQGCLSVLQQPARR